MDNQTVASIAEFQEKYGRQAKGFSLLVEAFLQRAPEFRGNTELAREIRLAMADLESALAGEKR